MSMTLEEMIQQHESLSMPDRADDDVMDDLIFMTHDMETMVLGYADAILAGLPPGFELDASRIEKHMFELNRFEKMTPNDCNVQRDLLARLSSLVRIRDYLKMAHP